MTMQRNLSALFCASALALSLSACSDNKAPATDAASTGADASQSGTLDKIKKSGTIVLGYRDSSIPFSISQTTQINLSVMHMIYSSKWLRLLNKS